AGRRRRWGGELGADLLRQAEETRRQSGVAEAGGEPRHLLEGGRAVQPIAEGVEPPESLDGAAPRRLAVAERVEHTGAYPQREADLARVPDFEGEPKRLLG